MITLLEIDLTSDCRHSKTITVVPDAMHHSRQQMLRFAFLQFPKAKRVQRCDGSRPHRENIPVDPPHPRRCPLERLDRRWMIMGFDLEYDAIAAADIHQPGILLSGLHEHLFAFPREGLQPFDRILVATMLAPHRAESAQFCEIGGSAKLLPDQFELFSGEPKLFGRFCGNLHVRKITNPRSISLPATHILHKSTRIARFAGYGLQDCFCSEYKLEYLQVQALRDREIGGRRF